MQGFVKPPSTPVKSPSGNTLAFTTMIPSPSGSRRDDLPVTGHSSSSTLCINGTGTGSMEYLENTRSESMSSTTDFAQQELLEFQGADWSCDRWLRFIDTRLEAYFRNELHLRTRNAGMMFSGVACAAASIEYFVVGKWTRIMKGDIAGEVTFINQVVLILGLAASGLALRRNAVKVEQVGVASLFLYPLCLVFASLYRMTKLFGTQLAFEERSDCTSDSCYDDSEIMILLMAAACTPLIFRVRFIWLWCLAPWTTFVYIITSVLWGPATAKSHILVGLILCTVLYFWVSLAYRVEADSRLRWKETLQLRIENIAQRVELVQQQQWLRGVEERLEALGIGLPSDEQNKGGAEVAAPSRKHLCVPTPLQVHAKEEQETETTGIPAMSSTTSGASEERSRGLSKAQARQAPNALLAASLTGRTTNREQLRRMASRIQDPDYGMHAFFMDVVTTFPELRLFFCEGHEGVSSGTSAAMEYQRTIGAMFAVYWLLRLEGDGKRGFSYGLDEEWEIRQTPDGAGRGPHRKRLKFMDEMDWDCVTTLLNDSLSNSQERIEALLALTAFHDIMKVQALCPRVSEATGPYEGYAVGDIIDDHDLALAYILEHYPDLLPSFRILPKASQDVVLFTQSKMNFNHGWFVQAEATPGLMLSQFKKVLGSAAPADLAFYFVHWLTDLSGAEGYPLAGAEKFVLKFPTSVLQAMLWSIPYLQRLTSSTETEVVETYLRARFETAIPNTPYPDGGEAIAILRLVVMAQGRGNLVLQAFKELPHTARNTLAVECARTGIKDQHFNTSREVGGPALFVYYGPAILQCATNPEEMANALRLLAAVYHAGRFLFPVWPDMAAHTVSLEAGCIKANAAKLLHGDHLEGKLLVLERKTEVSASVSLVLGNHLNELIYSGERFLVLDLNDLCSSRWEGSAYTYEIQTCSV